MIHLSETIENAHIISKHLEIYKYHKENTEDELFSNEYANEIALCKVAATEMLKHYKKLPNIKETLAKLNLLQEKKEYSYGKYSASKDIMDNLF